MQHIFEFVAIKKLTPEEITNNTDTTKKPILPVTINRYFNSDTSRMSKVTTKIYNALERGFGIKANELENFLLRKIR